MKAEVNTSFGQFFSKNRYLLLLLLTGIILIMLPGGAEKTENTSTEEELRLLGMLKNLEGVGEVYVLLAEENIHNGGFAGAIVVCQGADNAEVRLRIVEAVSAYTGLGSNRIMVLKMKN